MQINSMPCVQNHVFKATLLDLLEKFLVGCFSLYHHLVFLRCLTIICSPSLLVTLDNALHTAVRVQIHAW